MVRTWPVVYIRERREALGLTVTQLADRMDVTPGAVSQWESGLNVPGTQKLPRLAAVLQCTIDDLFHEYKEVG